MNPGLRELTHPKRTGLREKKLDEKNVVEDPRDRFVASIERFLGILLDRLAESPTGKMMDEKETRMLGSVVMRSYNTWMKALALRDKGPRLEEKIRQLEKIEAGNRED